MPSKILIITYDMIPHAFTWGGCQRMYYLAQTLIKAGHQVDVIALRHAPYNTFGKELLPSVIFTEDVYEREENSEAKPAGTANTHPNWLTSKLRSMAFLFDRLYFNEIIAGNGLKAFQSYRKAKSKICRQLSSASYDAVIVSAPPFVVFNTISDVKKTCPSLRVIMDYRDPWNSWHTGNKLCERREKKLQRMADIIVCTNQALCDDMSNKYGISREKYRVVANGFVGDVAPFKEGQSILGKDKMNIVYTGAIGFSKEPDGYRDTSKLFDAFRQLLREGINDVRLVFVGEANSDKEYLQSLRSEFGENLLIIGHVDTKTAKQYVQDADVCLLLHTATDNSGKYLISGKAYDYIQMQKGIFSISNADSQHAILLRDYNVGINTENYKAAIHDNLCKLYRSWKEDKLLLTYKSTDSYLFSRDSQNQKYLKIIDL